MLRKVCLFIIAISFPFFSLAKSAVCTNTPDFVVLQQKTKTQQFLNFKNINKPIIKENKKWVALIIIVLAGMLGGHRLYLGTQPWVPAIYLLTFGGGFLLLPLIDFFVLLFANDIHLYIDNPNFFMWIN